MCPVGARSSNPYYIRARGVDGHGVLQLNALHAASDADRQQVRAVQEQQEQEQAAAAALARARGTGASSSVAHHAHRHRAEADDGGGGGGDGHEHGVLGPVAKTLPWSDGLLTSFPHGRPGAGSVAVKPGQPGGPPLHGLGAGADDDPRLCALATLGVATNWLLITHLHVSHCM